MSDMTIEVRCKGVFAYLRGSNGARWVAVPPSSEHHSASDEHLCHLYVRTGVVDASDPRFVDTNSLGFELGNGFRRFHKPVRKVVISGAQFAPPKDGATAPIPTDGKPNGPTHLDSSWTSQGFIPSLQRLYPPGQDPVSDVGKAIFRMELPANTEWHGLVPGGLGMKDCTWDFINQETMTAVIPRQAITDRVGFHLLVPLTTELSVTTGDGTDVVTVDFSSASGHPLELEADPTVAATNDPPVEPNQPPVESGTLLHFKTLYNLSKPRLDVVLPVRRCEINALAAGNIFCPGGEGEGEDEGGGD